METKPFTPNRSADFPEDTKGISYIDGNRHGRRRKYALDNMKPKIGKRKRTSGSDKLPKVLWVKGKSKFVEARLKEEGKKCVAELY